MWHSQTVTVVFPCYNEEEGITKAIHDFFNTGYVDEIIVVDNNSTDRSAELVRLTEAKTVSEKQQGVGFATLRGLAEASGDLIVMAEPDGTFLGKDILKLLAYADDFDIVLGTRTIKETISKGSNMGFFMRTGNWIVAKLLQLTFNTTSLTDSGCTMRLLHRTVVKKLLPHLTVGRSHYLPEMIILGHHFGAKIIEIPLNYCPRRGESKITGSFKNTLGIAINIINLIFKYRIKLWFAPIVNSLTQD
jgi:glycosyltransferase involved in cell wall biosynthesis